MLYHLKKNSNTKILSKILCLILLIHLKSILRQNKQHKPFKENPDFPDGPNNILILVLIGSRLRENGYAAEQGVEFIVKWSMMGKGGDDGKFELMRGCFCKSRREGIQLKFL